uniref:Uncharacterized protein n=1 Tax=Entomoneis paludosa TaxID=265537 RepID=A0A7S2Y6Y8_9STRA|mmetsp:Transcript_2034/g.4284  ORF Transcript_2034/g.4284 Transcript_2034/m.4284 type:complete len:133 (+) Transcript_2034:162-560(+)
MLQKAMPDLAALERMIDRYELLFQVASSYNAESMKTVPTIFWVLDTPFLKTEFSKFFHFSSWVTRYEQPHILPISAPASGTIVRASVDQSLVAEPLPSELQLKLGHLRQSKRELEEYSSLKTKFLMKLRGQL